MTLIFFYKKCCFLAYIRKILPNVSRETLGSIYIYTLLNKTIKQNNFNIKNI